MALRRDILCGLGLTEAELIEIRDAAIEQLTEQRVVTGFQLQTGNGTGRGKQWQTLQGVPPGEVLDAVKLALYRFDPVKYAGCKPRSSRRYFRFIGGL